MLVDETKIENGEKCVVLANDWAKKKIDPGVNYMIRFFNMVGILRAAN